jgi:hypothetical protein
MLNKDYREMLQCLLEENVRFLLVGAYAVAVHGFPRATKDIDFFVWATPENAANLVRALTKFGAPLHDISEADFSSEGIIFQIGNSPRRIDIITNISGSAGVGVGVDEQGQCRGLTAMTSTSSRAPGATNAAT